MPIYEYKCESCQQISEAQQSFKDPPLTVCPACGKGPIEKIISRTSFALKGTGYYSTDYKKPVPPKSDAGGGQSASAPACAAPACGSGACSN